MLSFIVREEYHLKKLAVGAYNLNILPTQLLNDLAHKSCTTLACGDYVIVYNFTENSNKINVILFNIRPSILKKDKCIFKLIYSHDTVTDKMLDEPVVQQEQHANSQLFKSAFAADTDSGASSDECDDDDGSTRVDDRSVQDDDPESIRLPDAVPAKRQKLDDSVESQV